MNVVYVLPSYPLLYQPLLLGCRTPHLCRAGASHPQRSSVSGAVTFQAPCLPMTYEVHAKGCAPNLPTPSLARPFRTQSTQYLGSFPKNAKELPSAQHPRVHTRQDRSPSTIPKPPNPVSPSYPQGGSLPPPLLGHFFCLRSPQWESIGWERAQGDLGVTETSPSASGSWVH